MKFKQERFIKQRAGVNGWSFQVRVPNKPPRTFSETRYGSARRAYDEAIIYRNQIIVDDSMVHKNNQIKLSEILDETFDLLQVREETKRKHLMYFNNYIQDKKITDVTKADIIKSLNGMVKECSDDTINRVLSIWRRIYKTAIIKEYVNVDLTQGIVTPKSQVIKKTKREVITSRETLDEVEQKVIEHFEVGEAHSVCMALETMWYLGLRPAECFALGTKDVCLENGTITVNKELGSDIATSGEYDLSKANTIRTCKTECSNRILPIPTKLRILFNSYHPTGEIMFPNKYGNYFNLRYLQDKIRRLGVDFTMYQLRHSLATRLIVDNPNIDSRTIQEILGHESFNMSIYYARSNEEKKMLALENV